jgi:hypothetical protein
VNKKSTDYVENSKAIDQAKYEGDISFCASEPQSTKPLPNQPSIDVDDAHTTNQRRQQSKRSTHCPQVIFFYFVFSYFSSLKND